MYLKFCLWISCAFYIQLTVVVLVYVIITDIVYCNNKFTKSANKTNNLKIDGNFFISLLLCITENTRIFYIICNIPPDFSPTKEIIRSINLHNIMPINIKFYLGGGGDRRVLWLIVRYLCCFWVVRFGEWSCSI